MVVVFVMVVVVVDVVVVVGAVVVQVIELARMTWFAVDARDISLFSC